ncbi:MAG: GAF domain-containing sensor histidine kinase [Lentisphaerae bacterium]|jgi:signal transduction histidine kinase|nr:GAF domain-containing sensor histidine kinase [Lentisphaerota bacterium]MBT5604669.1 GAF domain-containing sensor histidine kinase [Lentisphaerota bacterium]MBT7056867.1 GAF domain-containing sensor histidine kinase [Lentisphaerota bacterium]MBT7844120.1 GAF domain-containing sensor histidine kinase [Lentisphaerota bacterium]
MPDQRQAALRYIDLPPDVVFAEPLTATEKSVLDQVNQKVAAAESLKDLVRFLFSATRSVCPCDRMGIAFVEEDRRRIRSYFNIADYTPVALDGGYAENLQHSSLREVIERGSTRIISRLDAYLQEHPDSASTKLILREGVRSNMTSPLSVEGRNVGVLFRSARSADAFTDHDVAMHQRIAERLGQAVDKAYRIEQLQAANHAYLEMLSFVSHELKSPVASMLTDVSLLQGGYLGELNAKQAEKLRRMTTKGEYLLGLVGEYLDLARMEGGQVRADIAAVADFSVQVVEPSVEIVQPQLEAKSMTLDREIVIDAPVLCDQGLLRIVMVNLLGNAVKYGRPEGRVELRVKAGPEQLEVAVWNEGPGFPASQRSRLFRRFSRLDTPELRKRKGTGVGLYTCWNIIEMHGGRITASSQEGEWAEFAFTIPQPPATDRG